MMTVLYPVASTPATVSRAAAAAAVGRAGVPVKRSGSPLGIPRPVRSTWWSTP